MREFLIEKTGRDQMDTIDSPYTRDHLPCFMQRIHTPKRLTSKKDIRKFIKLAVQLRDHQVEAVCISVTESDLNYEKWLAVAQEDNIPLIGPFESIHGYYKCWAMFPSKPFEVIPPKE